MNTASRWLAALTVGALSLAACGNSGDEEESAPEPRGVTAEESSAEDSGSDGGDRDTFVSISGVPGVTDDEIVFDVIGTKANNPLGTCLLDCYVDGIQAYFDHRNAEGGIYGRELVIGKVLDDELVQNQVKAIDVISSGRSFGVFNATLVASGFGDLDDAGVPTFVWNIHATEAANRRAIFGQVAALCSGCTTRALPYLVQQSGATKVASLGYGVSENSKVCAQTNRASIELYADDIGGAEVTYFNDDLAYGLPNGIGPEVTAMKEAGVEFIASCMDLNAMKTLGQELERQGMTDVVMAHPNTYNQDFVAGAGDIFEGDYVTVGFLPFEAETDNELQDAFEQRLAENGKDPSELAMVGFINADEAFSALLAAGPEFDRASVIDAFNRVTDYDAGGLVAPIDWTVGHTPATPGEPAPVDTCTAALRVVDGEFETVADPSTPFLCWDNSTLDWVEPEAKAFGAD